jgi:hypothetical protein
MPGWQGPSAAADDFNLKGDSMHQGLSLSVEGFAEKGESYVRLCEYVFTPVARATQLNNKRMISASYPRPNATGPAGTPRSDEQRLNYWLNPVPFSGRRIHIRRYHPLSRLCGPCLFSWDLPVFKDFSVTKSRNAAAGRESNILKGRT